MIDTKALRSRILDLAIQDKLTEQLESDGTAEELYQQIQAEKQILIKEGKIKKEKPLPEISADEIPFEIPSNWKWIKFSNIIALQSGQDLTKDEYNDRSAGIPYMTGASNYNNDGSLIINRWTETPKALAENGDILLSCKGTVGKIAILSIDKVHIARQIMGIRVFIADNAYVSLFLKSAVNGIIAASKGLIPGIERKDVLNLNIPLPPLTEQKRIVERVEEIFRLLDTIDKAQEKYSADSQILKAKLITAGI
ncbi:MAG: restriction endonuclease subunit S [Ruminococcus sp.]|nr:restriction endonuclease subunit S [Ruminococcus sp.]